MDRRLPRGGDTLDGPRSGGVGEGRVLAAGTGSRARPDLRPSRKLVISQALAREMKTKPAQGSAGQEFCRQLVVKFDDNRPGQAAMRRTSRGVKHGRPVGDSNPCRARAGANWTPGRRYLTLPNGCEHRSAARAVSPVPPSGHRLAGERIGKGICGRPWNCLVGRTSRRHGDLRPLLLTRTGPRHDQS
jgi:hypothetical protein